MKKEEMGCPITLGEFERLMKNKEVMNTQLTYEQLEWLRYFFNRTEHTLKNCVLQVQDGVLWVITNTKNSIKQFETVEGVREWE